jgi:hypothetical protein
LSENLPHAEVLARYVGAPTTAHLTPPGLQPKGHRNSPPLRRRKGGILPRKDGGEVGPKLQAMLWALDAKPEGAQ